MTSRTAGPPSATDLLAFLEVATAGSLTRAAERLGVSQPSVTVAMQRLERRVGVPLLVRSKQGVSLTRPGQLLATRAQGLVGEWEALARTVSDEAEEPQGRLTIGCHVTVARHWLPRLLPPVLSRWPRLEVHVVHELSRRVNDLVAAHELDLGLVVNPLRHPDLVIRELATDVFTAWDVRGQLSPTALFDPDLRQAQTILQQLQRRGVHFSRTVTSSSLETLAHLAAAGVGTAILPTHLALQMQPTLRPPRVSKLPRVIDSICLVSRAEALRLKSRRSVFEALRDAAAASTRAT